MLNVGLAMELEQLDRTGADVQHQADLRTVPCQGGLGAQRGDPGRDRGRTRKAESQ